jgi:hypothetical protein
MLQKSADYLIVQKSQFLIPARNLHRFNGRSGLTTGATKARKIMGSEKLRCIVVERLKIKRPRYMPNEPTV